MSICIFPSPFPSAVFYALGSLVLRGFQAEPAKFLTTVLLSTGQMCSVDVLDSRWVFLSSLKPVRDFPWASVGRGLHLLSHMLSKMYCSYYLFGSQNINGEPNSQLLFSSPKKGHIYYKHHSISKYWIVFLKCLCWVSK